MMPAKMISEIPLPMPYSVISSPNHISMMVPAVSTNTICRRWNQSTGPRIEGVALWHGQVTAPLLDAGAAVLAVFGNLLDPLGDHRHQLHDDRGVDEGIHAHRDEA